MKHLLRDGTKLCFVETGSGSPPLIFVHGWTCNHTYFAPQHEHFAKKHRVLSVDLRGHGESDKPQAPYPLSMLADDLAWLMRELRVEHPVVVGHSMGGMVALELAAQHPDLCRAIVTCDSPIVTPQALASVIGGLSEQFRTPNWRPAHRSFISDGLFIATDDPKRKERIINEMTSAPEHVIKGCWDGLIAADMAAAAARCKVPFLCIAAAAPLSDFTKLRELCPHVVTGQTVGAGHFHQLEVPEQVNGMIERFLKHLP
jgi:pimeloyl-ACP methyl ester carboxylesterase